MGPLWVIAGDRPFRIKEYRPVFGIASWRFILLGLALYIAWRLIKRWQLRQLQQDRLARQGGGSGKAATTKERDDNTRDLVHCPQCGVYVPVVQGAMGKTAVGGQCAIKTCPYR
jgi:hypothetical protein